MNPRPLLLLALAGLPSLAAGQDVAAADPATVGEIEVIASSPLGPASADPAKATANVQRLSADELERPGLRSVGDALARLGDVFAADATTSRFQPDVFFRGYSISPLLGVPQGLSVYLDGVRVNELFGDVVNLDLVPLVAVREADLVPGANPVFGRNTLGGALALRTKSGFDAVGRRIDVTAGNFGRHGASGELGAAGETLAIYGAAELEGEDGWRDFSKSRVQRAFVRGSWRPDAASAIDLTLGGADNRLRGNGAAPRELLDAEGRDAVFTNFDETRSRLLTANLIGTRALAGGGRLSGNLYVRRNHSHSFNGDGTEFESCEDPGNTNADGDPYLCEADDEGESVVEDLAGDPVLATADNDSATRNRGRTRQRGIGASIEWEQAFGRHRVTLGAAVDRGRIRFESDSELARLTDDRGTEGSGILVAGNLVRLHARNDSVGAYAMDAWTLAPSLEATIAARWNHTRVELEDQLPEGDLSGTHHFSRVNPMAGLTWSFAPGWTAFGSVSQSTRAPTPVELTCANPDDPCSLPNGFVDDPPLDEVVTRSVETGMRYRANGFAGSLALFHADNRDDILFITDGTLTNQGFFANVGSTVRQGIEASLARSLGAGFELTVQATALTAEFRDAFLVSSPHHPVRDPAEPEAPDPSTRQVSSGDRIPLIPRLQYRVALAWLGDRVETGVELVGRGSARYRGDESNRDPVKIGGFALVNANASWVLRPWVTLYASVDNLFDRDVATFGVYGESDDVLGDAYEDARRFVGPGAPRTFEGGIRIRF